MGNSWNSLNPFLRSNQNLQVWQLTRQILTNRWNLKNGDFPFPNWSMKLQVASEFALRFFSGVLVFWLSLYKSFRWTPSPWVFSSAAVSQDYLPYKSFTQPLSEAAKLSTKNGQLPGRPSSAERSGERLNDVFFFRVEGVHHGRNVNGNLRGNATFFARK